MTHEAWIMGQYTGLSSITIWAVMIMMGKAHAHGRPTVPLDPDDFGRCYRLLLMIPGWHARLPEVAVVYPEWAGLVEHWAELETLWIEEHHSPDHRAPKLYCRIQELIGKIDCVPI